MNTPAQAFRAALAHASHVIHSQGWVPAVSGNFSVRLASGIVAINSSEDSTPSDSIAQTHHQVVDSFDQIEI